MKKTDLLQKIASRREKLADHVQSWGLPKERLFPLDSPDLVKAASVAFEDQVDNMNASQRLVCARNICHRAGELGVSGIESTMAYKYAGADLSPHFSSFINLRKEASAHIADEELNKLVEVANFFQTKADVNDRVEGLDKVAWALEDFDHRHGLSGHWDENLPDPSYTTYGLTADPNEQIELVVKVAGYDVRAQDLEGADWSRIEGKLSSEIVEGVKNADDKLAVFASLPDPEKEVIYQSLFTG